MNSASVNKKFLSYSLADNHVNTQIHSKAPPEIETTAYTSKMNYNPSITIAQNRPSPKSSYIIAIRLQNSAAGKPIGYSEPIKSKDRLRQNTPAIEGRRTIKITGKT